MTCINAHRGDPIRHRENTMPAFAGAVALGADCIELDIHCSGDEQAVVLHDPTLERLWGIEASIASLPYERIQSITKKKDVYVPCLEEVLSAFDIPIMVDFTDVSAVKPIVRVLKDQDAVGRCIISSGNINALQQFRSVFADIAIALTWNDVIPPSERLAQELDFQYFNPDYRMYQDSFIQRLADQWSREDAGDETLQRTLKKRHDHPEWYAFDGICGAHMVHRMHENERKASAWTVDDPADMEKMIHLGVDLITTNDTKTLVEVRNGSFSGS